MTLTKYPNGISSFGCPVLPALVPEVSTGNVFFVDSNTGVNSGPYGRNPDEPCASIDYAIGKCTASKGDTIYVMPGHTETISAAGGITADVIGIQIIGLGWGTLRPKISFSATASTFLVTAANVVVKNMQLQNTIDAVVSGISVTAAGVGLYGCDFSQPTSTHDCLIWIITSAAADDAIIQGNTFRQSHAGPTECIRLVGADRVKILDNYIIGSYSTAAINGITTASTEILIARNTICNSVTDGLLIDLVANCTGRIEYNSGTVVSTGNITAANIIDGSSCQLAENYVSDAAGETGKLIGTVSA